MDFSDVANCARDLGSIDESAICRMGEDGVTSTPFTSKLGKDDVVLAGDGGYFGLAKDH